MTLRLRLQLPAWLRRFWMAPPPCEWLVPGDGVEYENSIARAKATQERERALGNIDDDGKVRRLHGLNEIHRGTADNLKHFADHQPSGYAFTFKPKDK